MELQVSIMNFLLRVIVFLAYTVALGFIWNLTIPFIFGLPQISGVQALGLYILSNILFKDNFCVQGVIDDTDN